MHGEAEPGPLFSVVIPTRDRPALLPAAVASVLGQTIGDLEVVVVDDAGSVAPALPDDERVRLVRHDVNRGPAASRNTGAAAARGRYLAFLDDDDLWVPHRLELALAGLARAPIAVCWSRYADEVPEPKVVLDGDVADVILDHPTPMLNAVALDRDAFAPLDERYLGTEDVAWWLAAAQRHPVATVPEVGVVVRRHGGARVLHGDRARIEGSRRLLAERADWFAAHPRAEALRWLRIGLTAARAGDVAEARHAYVRSFRTRPSMRPIVHLARAARAREERGGGLRVLQVVTDTDRRGAQVFATDLAGGLTALGHDVRTVALAPGTHAVPLPVDVLGPTRRSWRTLVALRRAARDVDVVVAHGSTTLPVTAVATAGLRTPFVYRQISESLFWAPTPWARQRVSTALGRAAAVVTLSPSAGEVLVEHFGVPRSKLHVVPNAVPAAGFAPATNAARAIARARFGLPADATVVLAIGALVPEKGVDLAVDAVRSLDAHLLVVGDGPERGRLEARAGERVVFTGPVDDPAVAYAASDVVVLPSRGGDSMPATLIEAALCGLAAVATPVGAIDEIVVDGETGRIVPVDDLAALTDAIAALVHDPGARARLGAAARLHAEARFTIDAVGPRWAAALAAASGARIGRR